MPCLVNLQPSGQYLMEDFCYAGGLPAVMKEIEHLLHLDIVTASGKTVARTSPTRRQLRPRVIKTVQRRSRRRPASPCCAATWRRAAPSSSPARPPRR
jgi:dihydroxyacid dehydratase/phosphogluconate dehydratase